MATERHFVCDRCKSRKWIFHLFDTLREKADGKQPTCPSCGEPQHIELDFDFGLRGNVLASFLPDRIIEWTEEDKTQREFYPFLVFVESLDRKERSVWTPYWHVITKEGKSPVPKYGQFASCLTVGDYHHMVEKARKAGFEI